MYLMRCFDKAHKPIGPACEYIRPTVTGFVVSLLVWATPYYWLGRYIEYRLRMKTDPNAPL